MRQQGAGVNFSSSFFSRMWVPEDASLMGSLENLKRPEITTAREGKLCITFKTYAQMTTRGQIMNNVLSRRFIKHAIHFTEKRQQEILRICDI